MKLIQTINIPKLSSKKVIADSKLFYYIDSDFKNWKADEKGKATKAMKLDIFEMDKDAKFSEMMSPDNLLTQEQILHFVENHKDLLSNWSTFFPFKSNGEVFVAFVRVDSDEGPDVSVVRFSDDDVWDAEYRHRIVVPQLATEKFVGSNDPLTPSLSVPLKLREKIKELREKYPCSEAQACLNEIEKNI